MLKRPFHKSVLVVFFILLTVKVSAPVFRSGIIIAPVPIEPYEALINAIIQVESEGNTMAYNDLEEAVGALQIRPIRLLDYNQRTGRNIKPSDCYNLEVSKEIFLYYADKIGYRDYETIARKWNGSGKTTLEYWERVKSYL